jgi:hypothetical protein
MTFNPGYLGPSRGPEMGEDGLSRGSDSAPRLQTFEHMMRGVGEEAAFTSSAGVKYTFEDDPHTGELIIRGYQDVHDILELNKAMLCANDGYSRERDIRRVASIPALLRNKILIQTNNQVDLWRPETDPKYYKKFLNDIDNRHLRTAPGRL